MNWTSVFLTASVLSMGQAIMDNGVSDWLTSLMPAAQMGAVGLVAFSSLLTFALLVIVPGSLPLITILTAPLAALAGASGFPPELVMLTAGFAGGCCFLLPLDVVPLLTFGTGYYTMGDCFKSSAPIQLWLVVVMSLWFPLAARLMGWI